MACASLGSASDISIFLFGNYNNQFTTLSGRVAAGGNVTFTDQVISSALPVSTTRADLIIGGSVDITRGFNNGNTVISPTSTVIAYTMINNNGVTPQPIVDTPIDFASSQAYLQCLSTGWSTLTPNGTAANVFGNMQITGTDPNLNVITFNGNDVDGSGLSLEGASQILLNFPAGSTVLINVLGTEVGFGNYQMNVNGASPPDPTVGATILWNFPEATTIRNGNGVYTGSVLAPFANMVGNGFCQINGQLITGSYDGASGSVTTKLVLFNGCLPEVAACGGAALTVTKLVNGAASFTGVPGTPITYSITITNNSSVPINNIVITDESLGITNTVPMLNPGESFPFMLEREVRDGLAGTQYNNTVTVTSKEAPTVSATVTVTIAALPINVQFTKSVSQTTAIPGDQIIYTFTLNNMGNTELTNVHLVDPTIGLDFTVASLFSGMITQQTFTIPAASTSGSIITNTARLTADNLPSPGFLDSSATVTISSPPMASFRKSASTSSALPGTTIQYSYTIQNNSDTALQSLVLSDQLLNFTRTIPFITPNTTVVFEAPYTIPSETAAGTTIVNNATLSGSFGTLTSSATVMVKALLSLFVTKDLDNQFVVPGGTINYSVQALNNGNVSLSNVQLSDPLTGFQTTIPTLPVGPSQVFTSAFIVPPDTPAGTIITNTIFAHADGVEPVSAFVSAVVIASPTPIPPMTPIIAITGTVNRPAVLPGETVTFTGTVTNISAVTVRNLIVRSPFFQYASLLRMLDPGATLTLNGDFTVPPHTAPGTVITATLQAASSTIQLQESAASFVVLPLAAAALRKTVNKPEILKGDTAIYTVIGENTGNIPITNILFTDTALNQRIEVQSLSPGVIVSSFFHKSVTEEPGTTFCNEAVVTAPEIGTITDRSCYTVFGLQLRKQANASVVTVGSSVNYSIIIRNPMNVPASGIIFRDPLPDHSAVVAGSVQLDGRTLPDSLLAAGIGIPPLGPSASAAITFSLTAVSEPEGGALLNRAEASFRFVLSDKELSGTSFSNTVSVAVEEHEE